MASSTIKAPQVKEFTYTTTTSAVGTWSIADADLPSDFHCAVGIKNTSNRNCYAVQYDYKTFGIYTYTKDALANTSHTLTVMYV